MDEERVGGVSAPARSSRVTAKRKNTAELQFGGAVSVMFSTCAALVINQGGRSTVELYMRATALSVKGQFSPYSHHVASALRALGELSSSNRPCNAVEQRFFDRLISTALRNAAEGIRRFGIGQGVRQDEQGLADCAQAVSALAAYSSSEQVCDRAARAILANAPNALAVLDASAYALGGAA